MYMYTYMDVYVCIYTYICIKGSKVSGSKSGSSSPAAKVPSDDDDVYWYKLQQEGVIKSILYTLLYRKAK
jgi:hypothetical protein